MTGRKIYYKVKVRICNLIEREERLRIVNDGYVIIEDEEFEGYLALDYLEGTAYQEDEVLSIQILDFENFTENFLFSGEIDAFELPGTYILDSEVPNDDKICYLEFVNIEIDPLKQKEINSILQDIKKIHQIPN